MTDKTGSTGGSGMPSGSGRVQQGAVLAVAAVPLRKHRPSPDGRSTARWARATTLILLGPPRREPTFRCERGPQSRAAWRTDGSSDMRSAPQSYLCSKRRLLSRVAPIHCSSPSIQPVKPSLAARAVDYVRDSRIASRCALPARTDPPCDHGRRDIRAIQSVRRRLPDLAGHAGSAFASCDT